MKFERILLVVAAAFAWASLGSNAYAQGTRPATAASGDTLEKAVAALRVHADAVFQPGGVQSATWGRPHASVAKVDPALASQVLIAMNKPLSGDVLKDSYMRFHLMYVVLRAAPFAQEPYGEVLADLLRKVPENYEEDERPDFKVEPREVWLRYQKLIGECSVKVGFPPFQKMIGPPDSFEYMDAAQRRSAEAAWKEAKELSGKWKRIDDPEAKAFNVRVRTMRRILATLPNEYYYAMLAGKDSKGLDRVVLAIERYSARDPARAADVASGLNGAYLDGMLSAYSAAELKNAAGRLKRVSEVSLKTFAGKGDGPQQATSPWATGWFAGGWTTRHLPDSLYTVITGIETDALPRKLPRTGILRPVDDGVKTTLPAAGSVKAETITLEMLDAAISRGVAALNKTLVAGTYSAENDRMYDMSERVDSGQQGLIAWALLSAREQPSAPWMQQRLNWVLAQDSSVTYERAMRLRMLGVLPAAKYLPWMKRDVNWLSETMSKQGNWGPAHRGRWTTEFGDNANGQYAVLGMWAAADAGVAIPESTWKAIDGYWRAAQRPAGAPGEGAWAVTSTASLKQGTNLNAFNNQVSAAMTAGGTLSLYITERYLYGPQRVTVGQTFSPELNRGIRWIDENFSFDNLDGDSDFYYYAWAIQNVGQVTGYRTLNKVDWFREATARLLNTQLSTGLWDGPKGPKVSTSFALLYLCNARGPLAISKVRFGEAKPGEKAAGQGAWNNRPNDLFNFVTDASRRMEVPISWQIADLDLPVRQLIESPLMYLATEKPLNLNAQQVAKLKEYVNAGGLVVCVPEGKELQSVMASMRKLGEELTGGREPRRVMDKKHPFYDMYTPVKGAMATSIYSNSIRPLVVIVEKDIGRDLQENKAENRDAFDLLCNLYVFATGREVRRARIAPYHLTQLKEAGTVGMTVARVKQMGEFEPEPMALAQLKVFMNDRHGTNLEVKAVEASELTKDVDAAFLTVTRSSSLPAEEAAALRKWVDGGGLLWVDAGGGGVGVVEKLQELKEKLGYGERDFAFLTEHAIVTGKELKGGYDNREARMRAYSGGGTQKPTLMGSYVGGNPAVLVFSGDVMSGVAGVGTWEIVGYMPTTARQVVANSLLWRRKVKEEAAAAATRPATTQAGSQPATTQAGSQPASTQAGSQPASTQAGTRPAGGGL